MKKVLIVGAGRHAAEMIAIYEQIGKKDLIEACFEDNSQYGGKKLGNVPILNLNLLQSENYNLGKKILVAIGSPKRRNIIERLNRFGVEYDTLIHPSVIKGDDLCVGTDTMICQGVIITVNVKIGNHCIINIGTTINHDCKIADYVTVSPGVRLAGNVNVEENVFIGIGVTVINNITIGKNSVIGAGACVVKDVEENSVVVGVPARLVRKIDEY